MALNDIYRVDAVFLQSGREWMIGEYYGVAIDDATKTPVEIATGLATVWKEVNFVGDLDQLMSDEVDLVSTVGQMIYPSIEFNVVIPWVAISGQVVQPPLPAHTTQLITQTGKEAGRSFQGRVYLSGVPLTFQQDGRLTTLAESEFAAHGAIPFGEHQLIPIGGSPLRLQHVNASKKKMKAADDPVFSDVASAALKPEIATQRNRTLTAEEFV